MKSILQKLPQIGLTLFGIYYFLGFGLPALNGNYSPDKFENTWVLAMFLVFTIALLASWVHEKIGGILFMLWAIGLIVLGLFFWADAGMVILLAVIVLFVGLLIYRKGIEKRP